MTRLGLASLALVGAAWAAAAAAPAYRWANLPGWASPPEVPASNPMSEAKVELGRKLFYDADLSIDGTMSCGTCHEQHRAFSDGDATHAGVHGEPGRRNAMSLANVGYYTPLTWGDPSLTSLEVQALVPIQGDKPVEMGMKGRTSDYAERLGGDPCYPKLFKAAFPERGGRIDLAGITQALSAFERTLVSFDSPYDRFRRGDRSALTPAAQRGLAVFEINGGCPACHKGQLFTDQAFHDIALYPKDGYPARDRGLIEISAKPEDVGRFRTPGLRNVALSAPYMHDGSVKTLSEAVRRHGWPLNAAQVSDVTAFLESLTDRTFVTDPRYALPKPGCPIQ